MNRISLQFLIKSIYLNKFLEEIQKKENWMSLILLCHNNLIQKNLEETIELKPLNLITQRFILEIRKRIMSVSYNKLTMAMSLIRNNNKKRSKKKRRQKNRTKIAIILRVKMRAVKNRKMRSKTMRAKKD